MAHQEQVNTEEEVQTYHLKSSSLFIVAGVLLTVLSVVPVGLILFWNLSLAQSPWLAFLCFALLFTPLLLWMSAGTYLVPGGKGLVHIRREGVELVTPKVCKRFPIQDLKIHITNHNANIRVGPIPMGTVNTDVRVRLEAQGLKHSFSRRLFADPDRIRVFIDDLERVQQGQPPIGATREQAEYAKVQSDPLNAEFEAQLDAELDAMD